MFVKLEERKKGDLDLGLIYGGIGIFGFLGAKFFSGFTALLPHCPFHLLTGLPCPTCGVTRSGILLSQFRIIDAFLTNPLFVVICFGIGLWAFSALALHFLGKRLRFESWNRAKPVIRILLVVVILVNWVYLIIVRV